MAGHQSQERDGQSKEVRVFLVQMDNSHNPRKRREEKQKESKLDKPSNFSNTHNCPKWIITCKCASEAHRSGVAMRNAVMLVVAGRVVAQWILALHCCRRDQLRVAPGTLHPRWNHVGAVVVHESFVVEIDVFPMDSSRVT